MRERWLFFTLTVLLISLVLSLVFVSIPIAILFLIVGLFIAGCIRLTLVFLFYRAKGSKLRNIIIADEADLAFNCLFQCVFLILDAGNPSYNILYITVRAVLIIPVCVISIVKALYIFQDK